MAGLKQIKTKIRSINKTKTVTKAMEAVSAAKMRKSQQRALDGRAYAHAATSILARVSGSKLLHDHPLTRGVEKSVVRGILYVVITSDKGLAGGLNSAVLRSALADIRAAGLLQNQISLIAVGRKANDFFLAHGFTVREFLPNTDAVTSQTVSHIVRDAAEIFMRGEVDLVKVVYQNFISTFEQRPTMHTVFPLSLQELSKVVADIAPSRGRHAAFGTQVIYTSTYSVEPSEEDVMNAIVPRLASIFLYHALLESQASEHSARMVSMKSASDKADEMGQALTLQFNKARQAAITREVSEITGGMEAKASQRNENEYEQGGNKTNRRASCRRLLRR